MVMFKEDEERIKAMERAEKEAKRGPVWRWARRIVKISLVLGILLFIGLTLLMRMAEDSEHLQAGIVDFLQRSSGMQVEIKNFEHMRLFPVVSLKLANLSFTEPDTEAPAIRIAKFEYAAGFWDLMFSRNEVRALSVKDVFISKAVTGRRDLKITSLGVSQNALGEKGPGVAIDGQWGGEALDVRLSTETKMESGEIISYRIGDESAFTMKLGDLVMNGKVEVSMFSGLNVDISELTDKVITAAGNVKYKERGGAHNIDFDLKAGSSTLQGDIEVTSGLIKGQIDMPELHLEDVYSTIELIAALGDIFSAKEERTGEISLPEGTVDVDFNVRDLRGRGEKLGQLNIPLKVVSDKMTINKFGGTFSGGKMSGDIVLDTSVTPTSLTVSGKLIDWDYGLIQEIYMARKNLSGTADVHVDLQAKGNTADALMNALNGKVTMIAGEGQFESEALNIWGAGLVRALIPNIGKDDLTKLNCMVADFDVENGVATANPFFIDTQRLKVIGDGKINLAQQRIDLTLEPEAKGAAFLDVATAVNVSGPLRQPDIGPSTFSLLEKIGGLALGTINPAFLAFSMTDLGLTDNHPCSQFFSEEEKAPSGTPAQSSEEEKAIREVNE